MGDLPENAWHVQNSKGQVLGTFKATHRLMHLSPQEARANAKVFLNALDSSCGEKKI